MNYGSAFLLIFLSVIFPDFGDHFFIFRTTDMQQFLGEVDTVVVWFLFSVWVSDHSDAGSSMSHHGRPHHFTVSQKKEHLMEDGRLLVEAV